MAPVKVGQPSNLGSLSIRSAILSGQALVCVGGHLTIYFTSEGLVCVGKIKRKQNERVKELA
jgi:hypothetical protein